MAYLIHGNEDAIKIPTGRWFLDIGKSMVVSIGTSKNQMMTLYPQVSQQFILEAPFFYHDSLGTAKLYQIPDKLKFSLHS